MPAVLCVGMDEQNRDVPLLSKLCAGVKCVEIKAGQFLFQEGKSLDKVNRLEARLILWHGLMRTCVVSCLLPSICSVFMS